MFERLERKVNSALAFSLSALVYIMEKPISDHYGMFHLFLHVSSFYFTSDKTNKNSSITVHIKTHKNGLYVRNEAQNMSVTFDKAREILI